MTKAIHLRNQSDGYTHHYYSMPKLPAIIKMSGQVCMSYQNLAYYNNYEPSEINYSHHLNFQKFPNKLLTQHKASKLQNSKTAQEVEINSLSLKHWPTLWRQARPS